MTPSEIGTLIATAKAMQRRAIAHVLASCEADIEHYRIRGCKIPIEIADRKALWLQRLQTLDQLRE